MITKNKEEYMTHDDVWGAIERFACDKNLTCSGLAKKSGLDPTAFNKSKRFSKAGQPRWPSTQSISKILNATGSTIEDFMVYLNKK